MPPIIYSIKTDKTMRHRLPFLLFALVITTARAEIWTPIDDNVSFDKGAKGARLELNSAKSGSECFVFPTSSRRNSNVSDVVELGGAGLERQQVVAG